MDKNTFAIDVVDSVTEFFAVGRFAVGHIAVRQFVVGTVCFGTVRRKDSLPWDS